MKENRRSIWNPNNVMCNFQARRLNFLNASESAIAKDIIENHEINLTRMRREKANVFYVAATRAIQTLTVFLPKNKDEKLQTCPSGSA